ncbi:MAG: YfhO family protein [Bacilli bacterium]|nr:YfhO family protein [Bacilli bacterium]
MLNTLKRKKGYIYSFIIPFIILFFIAFCLGFILKKYNNTLFVSDMYAQYKSLFTNLRTEGLSFYSFSKGLGSSMIGTYAYYLISPFNLIVFLFKEIHIHYAIMLIIFIKMSLCGLTMYALLKHHFKENKMLLIFSTAYALMAFNVNYYFHVMWLDTVYLLPLVLLGIDKIIRGKKPYLYIFALFLTVLMNYYLAFMVCIFSVLYFIYRLYLYNEKKKDKKEIFRTIRVFLISSIIGGLLTSFILVPTLFEFKDMPRGEYNAFLENQIGFNGNPLEIIGKLFIGSHNNDTLLSHYTFQIYTGILISVLVLLYFLNHKISKREKHASFIIVLIFIMSMLINYINYIWHGFNVPICFNGRYTFIFSCFLIYLAMRSLTEIKYITKLQYFIVAPIYPILGVITFIGQFPFTNLFMVYVTVALSFFYLLLLSIYGKNNKDSKIASYLLLFLVLGELFTNMFFSLQDFKFKTVREVQGSYVIMQKQVSKVMEKDSSTFYRMEKNFNYSATDPLYFSYNGIGTFLSTMSKTQLDFLAKLGYNVHNNIIEYMTTYPVSDSIFGMKYYMDKDSDPKSHYYNKIDSFQVSSANGIFYNVFKSDVSVYENSSALSIGTLTGNDVSKCTPQYQNFDRMQYQNNVISCLSGKDISIYEKIPLQKVEGTKFSFINTKRDNIIAYPNVKADLLKNEDFVELIIGNRSFGVYNNMSFIPQFFENKADLGITMTTETKNSKNNKQEYIPYLYYFNADTFYKTFNDLNKHSLQITKKKGSYMEGTASATKDNHYLFTTIPYDTGWTIKVDGKKIKYDKVFDTLIGFDLKEGNHKITFSYFPKGIKEGTVLSLVTLIGLGIFIFTLEKKTKKK